MMLRLLLFSLLCIYTLQASVQSRIYDLYQNGDYLRACNEGVKELAANKKDEKFISLYAFACLKADKIDRLALPIIMLKHSRSARKNAAYFSVMLMQKNLLIQALENRTPISGLVLPGTDYVLSKVFDLAGRSEQLGKKNPLTLTDSENPRRSYRLSLRYRSGIPVIIIEEYYDTIMTKRHIYR